MKLSEIPRREAGEGLEDYMRRALNAPSVSIGDLARWMDVQRVALYQIKRGGGAAIGTITKFGALTGVVVRDGATIENLSLFGLLGYAEAGWSAREAAIAEERKK